MWGRTLAKGAVVLASWARLDLDCQERGVWEAECLPRELVTVEAKGQ